MSPRHAPDLSKTKAGIRTFERGEYEILITGSKGIGYTREEDGKAIIGGKVLLEMVGKVQNDGQLDREFEGETVFPVNVYVHSEDGMGITKRFFMAALGYGIDDEDKFDAEVAKNLDIGVDWEEGMQAKLGAGWDRLKGKRLRCTLDKRKEKDGPREFQDHQSFMPVK